MIQFNLLPDVKKEYIRTKRIKRLIISTSSIVSIAALAILVILFSYVQIIQKESIKDLTEDIETEVASINTVQDLDKILTIQNQLQTVPEILQEKPETSRIFDYMRAVTPKGVFISSIELDVISNTMEISGKAPNLLAVNTYADSLKFATYTLGDTNDGKPFSSVLTDSSRNNEQSSYSITLEYDPVIFDNTADVVLVVPNTISTRSVTGQPDIGPEDALFIDEPSSEEQE